MAHPSKHGRAHGRPPRLPLLAAVTLGTCFSGHLVQAQGFDADTLDPAPNQDTSILGAYGGRALPAGHVHLGLWAGYASKPLQLREGNGGEDLGTLIGSISTFSALGSVGIGKGFDLGLVFSGHRTGRGSTYLNPPPAIAAAVVDEAGWGLGDLQLVPRFQFIDAEHFSAAVLMPLWVPIGNDELYVGEDFRLEPRLAAGFDHKGFLLLANVGYLVRSETQVVNVTLDDTVRGDLGVEVPLGSVLSVMGGLKSEINLFEGTDDSSDISVEADGGLRARAAGFFAQAGAGAGIVSGLGSPSYRMFLSVGYTLAPPAEEPFHDSDSDRDGLLDGADTCPNEPEDVDSFADADGCPDLDNDQDGIADTADRCPIEPEDLDQFQDSDGCPDLDNDADHIPDASDACPLEAEDVDQDADEDGCPEAPADPDGDGVLGSADACPTEAANTANGCPDRKVVLEAGRIKVLEAILFETGTARLTAASDTLIDEVFSVLQQHPEIEHVTVEGHTDAQGSQAGNLSLSQQRATAVVSALIARGTALERLSAKGFGEDVPLGSNDTTDGRAQNRRVVFTIDKTR